MNFLEVQLTGRGADRVAVLPAGAGLPLLIDLPDGDRCELGIRPENLNVVTEGGDLTGDATIIERLGDRTLIHVRLADGRSVTAQDSGRSTVATGDRVALLIDRSEVHMFDETGRAWHPDIPAAPALETA